MGTSAGLVRHGRDMAHDLESLVPGGTKWRAVEIHNVAERPNDTSRVMSFGFDENERLWWTRSLLQALSEGLVRDLREALGVVPIADAASTIPQVPQETQAWVGILRQPPAHALIVHDSRQLHPPNGPSGEGASLCLELA